MARINNCISSTDAATPRLPGEHATRCHGLAVRDVLRSGWPAVLALAVVVSSTLPVVGLPAMDTSRIRLMGTEDVLMGTDAVSTAQDGTYLIPPTNFPDPALIFTGDRLVELATPYITFARGGMAPPEPISQVDYPAALLDSTSVPQGVAALNADTAGDPSPVIFGYSQGAVVESVFKEEFNQEYANPAPGTTVPDPTFVLIGNPNRPDGGLSTRLESLHLPPIGGTPDQAIPTPTETAGAAPGEITTYDFVHQYDFFADFPNRPLDLFALTNAALGAILSHSTYGNVSPSDAILQAVVGDTDYYMIPTPVLPLLEPLALINDVFIPSSGAGLSDGIGPLSPLIAALDAPLRVLVEAGYDRTDNPGVPTGIELQPFADPLQTAENFLIAIPTGLDDAFQLMGDGRPFGTTPAGPYGVGGPPVTLTNDAATASSSIATSSSSETNVSSPDVSVLLQEVDKAGYNIYEALLTGNTTTIESAIQAGVSQVDSALAQFPVAVFDDIAVTLTGSTPDLSTAATDMASLFPGDLATLIEQAIVAQ